MISGKHTVNKKYPKKLVHKTNLQQREKTGTDIVDLIKILWSIRHTNNIPSEIRPNIELPDNCVARLYNKRSKGR